MRDLDGEPGRASFDGEDGGLTGDAGREDGLKRGNATVLLFTPGLRGLGDGSRSGGRLLVLIYTKLENATARILRKTYRPRSLVQC